MGMKTLCQKETNISRFSDLIRWYLFMLLLMLGLKIMAGNLISVTPSRTVCPGTQVILTAGTSQDYVEWFTLAGPPPLGSGNSFSFTFTNTVSIVVVITHPNMSVSRDTAQISLDTGDRDNDGVTNCNDGCPDDPNKTAPGACGCGASDADFDNDGVPNCNDGCPLDPHKTSPGFCGCNVSESNSDGDLLPDCLDQCPFDPNKLFPGACGCGVPDIDSDGDGVPNCIDGCPFNPNKITPGVCGCALNDIDSDGDGVLNCNDGCPFDALKITPGVCGCGNPDTDSDNDGVANCQDGCPNDPGKTTPGICGCGIADTDSDNDGTPNCNDQCPNDPNKIAPGICGCGVADTDSDNDGTPNCNDQCPNDPNKITPGVCGCGAVDIDSDNDGVLNCQDGCPNDPNKIAPGICGCGTADTDSDNDGTPNCNDQCPNDPNKIAPGICGCGTADTDSDNDGTPNCNDQCPNDPGKVTPGQCGCGIADTDTDNDGIANCNDQCPNDPNKTLPGVCGCGVSDMDTDNDGVANCNDQCPNDPNKTLPGVCGCGISDVDTDADGTPDCIDPCPFGILVMDVITTQAVCGPDGTATVSVISGGSGNYSYLWSNGGTTATILNLYPGTYRVTVFDNNTACSDSTVATVTPMPGTFFVLGFDSSATTCFGGNNGSATVYVSGGTGPFTFLWSNGQTSSTITNLSAGVYSVTATDQSSGCTGFGSVRITSPEPYVVDLGADRIVCPGVPVTLTVNNAVTANWYDVNGTLLLAGSLSLTVTTMVPRTIVVQAFSAFACIDFDTVQLIITNVDTDYDGTPDCIDNCPVDPNKINPGVCGCGVPDTDSDNDGTPDCNDQCPTDPNKTIIGLCGCFYPEGDTDNDGTPNCTDGCPFDPNKTAPGICGCGTSDADNDQDGTPNCNDLCPNDPNKLFPGSCGCGTADTDADGDGVPNCYDLCPTDPNKIAPGLCGCGISDLDNDRDGVPNCFDLCPDDPNKLSPAICGCGAPETDSDMDGVPNCIDGCPFNPMKTSPGQCGCATIDIDNDNDGIADCNDHCPYDPEKISPGYCGCGNPETDSDNDGLPDCVDLCPFGDLVISTFSTDAICGADGAAGVAVIGGGGSGNYNYQWSNGATTAVINNVYPGNYSATITDNVFGCTEIRNITVFPSPNSFYIQRVDTNHVTCFGANNGSINIHVANGVGPFNFNWTPNISSTSFANNLSPGTYTILVTDAFTGCTAEVQVIITQPPLFSIDLGPDKLSCGGNVETFSVPDAVLVNWRLTDGTLLLGDSFSYSFTFITTISIVAEAYSAAGCIAYDTVTLTIDVFDSDNDGMSNCSDLCPLDPLKIAPGVCGCGNPEFDSDADGTPDCEDNCPFDRNKTVPGNCGCGLPDVDTDNDGTPDCLDYCVADARKTVPGICGCGIPDNDTDGDGVIDCIDFCPTDSLKSVPGYCGCNQMDIDSDFDGVFDCHDQCPFDSNKILPGVCGCNVPDIDSDQDGKLNCEDLCPFDPHKTVPGLCGCGNPDNFFADAGNDIEICEGSTVLLTATGGTNYEWSNGTSTGINTVTPLETTTYYVTVSNNICSAVDSVTVIVRARPHIFAGNDTLVCTGSLLTLKASGAQWYFWNNGVNDSLNTIAVTRDTTLTVIGIDMYGCIGYDTIYLLTKPVPVAYAGDDTMICAGAYLSLNATGGTNYAWSNGMSGATITVSPTINTIYRVTVTGPTGCQAIDSVTITVNPTPMVDAGPSYITCQGDTRTLEATGTGWFLWSNGATSASITVSPIVTTTYSVTVTNGFQCQATDSATIYVNPLPLADAGDDVAVCEGESISLTATGGVKYFWSNGATTATISFVPSSTQSLIVSVTDTNGCSNTDEVSVTVNMLPAVNAGADHEICEGDSVELVAYGADTYSWNNGIMQQSFIAKPTENTIYFVTGTDANGCRATDTVRITVLPVPIPQISGATTVCKGAAVELTASGGELYIWNQTDTTNTFTDFPQASTSYQLEVINTSGCSATALIPVTVNEIYSSTILGLNENYCDRSRYIFLEAYPSGGVFIGNGVSGNIFNPSEAGQGIHTIVYIFTDANGCISADTAEVRVITCPGIAEADDNNSWKVYPNPFSEIIWIEWDIDAEQIYSVSLFDINGKEIIVGQAILPNRIYLETRSLSAGNYVLQIQTESNSYKLKVVKRE
jgi:hypothetical protein